MNLTALEVYCDVVRQRSFSQAARANEITQSAASQIVSQLEKRLEVQLIDRSTRPLQVTPLGQTFYEGCKALLEQYRELEANIKRARSQLEGSVEVAAIYSVGLGDMGQHVQRFQDGQPAVKVHVEYLHPDRVYERVLEGTADLGLVSFPRPSSKLAAIPWREEEMVLVCSPKHPLAEKQAIEVEDLTGQKYVHFDKNLVIRRQVDRFFRHHGIAVAVVHEFDNIENIKEAVGIGAGVALLPEPTVRREVRTRSLVALPLLITPFPSGKGQIDGERFTRPLGIIYRRRHRLSAASQKFMEMLIKENGQAGGNGEPNPFNKEETKEGVRRPRLAVGQTSKRMAST